MQATEVELLIGNVLRCIVDALDGMACERSSKRQRKKWLREDVAALDEAYTKLREVIFQTES